jgi:hypothetical protein
VEAVHRELSTGPFIYRYTGICGEEGAFLAYS